jgi:hypothetical protein
MKQQKRTSTSIDGWFAKPVRRSAINQKERSELKVQPWALCGVIRDRRRASCNKSFAAAIRYMKHRERAERHPIGWALVRNYIKQRGVGFFVFSSPV